VKTDVTSRKFDYFCRCFFEYATVKTLLLTLALVALAVMLLGVRIFFVRGGKFPNTHIHSNPEMRKRGITCAQDPEFNK